MINVSGGFRKPASKHAHGAATHIINADELGVGTIRSIGLEWQSHRQREEQGGSTWRYSSIHYDGPTPRNGRSIAGCADGRRDVATFRPIKLNDRRRCQSPHILEGMNSQSSGRPASIMAFSEFCREEFCQPGPDAHRVE